MINPGQIGGDGEKKEIAKPNAKIQAKIGERYQPKNKKEENKEKEAEKEKDKVEYKSKKVDPKHQIWSQQEVADLPISKDDPRKQPFFETMYRQKVGT